ncbi:uncharacterized protein LOC134689904 [Mytilus trossulus]|uniref:uncharacterized protein LOC134689904 n=1 Tax=Mytilus trossulus TaxID=6551 RepID=UPI0030052B5F
MADINKIWMYLCVFVVVLKTYSSTVVQDGLVTWSVASGRCGSSGLEFRESIFLKESGVLTNKTFWLGKAIYRKTSHWMEILGCYDSSVTPSKTPKLSGISSIAECQIQCSSRSYSHFGYKCTKDVCLPAQKDIVPLYTAVMDTIT